jgi:predicted phosphodiesterase
MMVFASDFRETISRDFSISMKIGLLSDAHGNDEAFSRGIALLRRLGATHFYFLGDAIGYVPSVSVLDSLQRLGDEVSCILGNHEAMLLKGHPNSTKDEIYLLNKVRTKLTLAHHKMIASWPISVQKEIDGQRLLFIHGSPDDPTYGYIYPNTDLAGLAPDSDWVFMANTHHPFIREQEGTYYCNIGSCGLPRDDGRYGSVALFDTEERSAHIFRFDIASFTSLLLERYSLVHSSVRAVYQRRSDNVFGEFL